MKDKEIEYIKKYYGEKFARLCRNLFPSILENEGELTKIIFSSFSPSRCLYDDIIKNNLLADFNSFVFSKAGITTQILNQTSKTPEELLKEAGYILYPECKNQKDLFEFTDYYAKNELICTLYGQDRTKICRVWFAVKENAKKLNREDYINPERQDEYGTSVISIQFTKDENCTLSIKNRYNHTVKNPDATFSNNLDNIIPGLTDAFYKTYGVKQKTTNCLEAFSIPGYCKSKDGKFYKSNVDILEGHFCENNFVVTKDGTVQYDKSRYILAENYLIDLSEKKILAFSPIKHIPYEKQDSFIKSFGEIRDIKLEAFADGKILTFIIDGGKDVILKLNKQNEIIGYTNENVTSLGKYFLSHNTKLKELNTPNVKSIESGFLYCNIYLEKADFSSLEYMGTACLNLNQSLLEFNAPRLKSMGNFCFYENNNIKTLYLPKLEYLGKHCFSLNDSIYNIVLPSLLLMSSGCFQNNTQAVNLDISNLIHMGEYCFVGNQMDMDITANNLKTMGAFSFDASSDSFLKLKKVIKKNKRVDHTKQLQNCDSLKRINDIEFKL